MVDFTEDMILNISNVMNDKNRISQKTNLINNTNNCIKNKKTQQSDCNKKFKLIDSYSTEEKDYFRNTNNFSYYKKYSNESIFPVKIKKMEKSDIIIKDDISKENDDVHKKLTKTKNNKNEKKILNNKDKKLPEKKYKCDKCNKSYNIKNSYQKHLLTHNKKKYICTKCNAKFSVKSKLSRHLLTHNDFKEFKCPQCDSAFHLKYNLKVHMRLHNNEKPYICGYPGCFAKFTQKNNLNTHSKTHSNNLFKEKDEIKILINYHDNIIKFINKRKNILTKLEELNKIALNE